MRRTSASGASTAAMRSGSSGVRGHFFGQSSFATHSLATKRNIVIVPRELPLELLAPLGCGLQTGAGTVMNSLAVPAGAGIAVFGTGAVGLAAVMAARIVGAGPIIGVDIIPWRLDLALELGATHVIDARREDVAARIAEITGSGVNFVVDTTGDPELVRLAVAALKPKGRVALLTGDMEDPILYRGTQSRRRDPGRRRAPALHPQADRPLPGGTIPL